MTPRTLRFPTRKEGSPFPKIEQHILEDRIGFCQQEIESAAKSKRYFYNNLSFMFSPIIRDKLVDFAHETSRSKVNVHEQTLKSRLNNLCENSIWNKCSNLESVVNLSQRNLSINEKSVLGLGLSFNLEPDVNNVVDSVVEIDKLIRRGKYDNHEADYIRGLVPPMLLSYKNEKPILPERFKKALKNLQSDRSIKVLPADKGGKTVVMDRSEYENKVFNLLSDTNTYEKLKKDPTAGLNSLVRKKIDIHLKEHPEFTDLKKRLIRPNFTLPYFYGLPKIHKPECPLRPVVSNIGSATRPLAGWIASILSKYVGSFSPSHIKNNVHFKNKLIEFQRENALSTVKLISFDIKALFTNIPTADVLKFIERKIEEGRISTPIPKDDFMCLIEVCVNNASFQFKDQFYKQRFGMAMGSPLSPILSNIYMEYVESELMTMVQHKPLLWLRYVDDVFAILDEGTDHLALLNEINALSPTIKFTFEMEKDGVLPFLDCEVINSEGSFRFNVYRKPTDAGMLLHPFSNHQVQVKRSVLFSLFLRAYRVCDRIYLDDEINRLYENFRKMGYTNHFINKVHGDVKRKHFARNSNDVSKEPANYPSNHISLPRNSFTESYIKPVLKARECSVHFKASNTIKKRLVSNKPKIMDVNNSPGIYMIPCKDCPEVYIGETGRSLKIRLREHRDAVDARRTNQNAVAKHVVTNEHPVDWGGSQLLYKCQDWNKRIIIESVAISETSSYNRRDGAKVIDRATRTEILNSLPKLKNKLPPNG